MLAFASPMRALSAHRLTKQTLQTLVTVNTWRGHIVAWTLCVARGWTVVGCWLAVGDSASLGDARALVAALPTTKRRKRRYMNPARFTMQCQPVERYCKWATVKAAEKQKSRNHTEMKSGRVCVCRLFYCCSKTEQRVYLKVTIKSKVHNISLIKQTALPKDWRWARGIRKWKPPLSSHLCSSLQLPRRPLPFSPPLPPSPVPTSHNLTN